MQDVTGDKRVVLPAALRSGAGRLAFWLWGLEACLTLGCLLAVILRGEPLAVLPRVDLTTVGLVWLSGSLLVTLLGWRCFWQYRQREHFQATLRLAHLIRDSGEAHRMPLDLDVVISALEQAWPEHACVRDVPRSERWRAVDEDTPDAVSEDGNLHHQLQQLRQERDRARQESRLKSRYLHQVRRELESLSDADDNDRADDVRLGGLVSLLERIGDAEDDELLTCSLGASDTTRGKRVLIVDDGPVNTVLARRVLTDQGLTVDTARSGEEALELLAENTYALVFMDIYMPSLDGIETSRRWRQREGGRAERSVLIALTANTSAADRSHFFAAGIDDYLAKPYRPQALIDVVHRWLPGVITTSVTP